ncbi:MAG TPA: efflux RND transporter permease subunit, partial [Rhodanobacteraceae bacterium]|nr:efflux RND transporter permease subunit [Rhodanobacteraceae bacterium]
MWITRVSVANPVFATMVMVALLVLGLVSYARLGVEQLPDITLPAAFVDIEYPGASPEAVEREVSRVVEESVNSIAGIKRITSRSASPEVATLATPSTLASRLATDWSARIDSSRADRVGLVSAATTTGCALSLLKRATVGSFASFGNVDCTC